MKEILFNVNSQCICVCNGIGVVSGSAEIYTAKFEFDDSWSEFAKTAVFECGNERVEQLIDNGECIIPWEILHADTYLRVGVYGVSGSKTMPTVYSDKIFVLRGAEPSEAAREHSADIFDQIVEIGEEASIAKERWQNMSAEAETLPVGSPATASYTDGVLTLGIPRGANGATASLTVNGETILPVDGNIDIGTVIRQHQDISGKKDKCNVFTLAAPSAVSMVDNAYYVLTNVSNLQLSYPNQADYTVLVRLTTAEHGSITIDLPASKYGNGVPLFTNGETYDIIIKSGTVYCAKALLAREQTRPYVELPNRDGTFAAIPAYDSTPIVFNCAKLIYPDPSDEGGRVGITHPEYPYTTEGRDIFSTDYSSFGFKPFFVEDPPEFDDDHYPVFSQYVETETEITSKWALAERPARSVTEPVNMNNFDIGLYQKNRTNAVVTQNAPTEITLGNVNYELTDVSDLTLLFPSDTSNLHCWLHIQAAGSGDISIKLPRLAKWYGRIPAVTYAWELGADGEYHLVESRPNKGNISCGESWTLFVWKDHMMLVEDENEKPPKPTVGSGEE